MTEAARRQLRLLQEDFHGYNPPLVPVVGYPSAVFFSKQVSKGLPCVFKPPCRPPGSAASTDALVLSSEHSPAQSVSVAVEYPWQAFAWTADYLVSAVAGKIEVAVTPTGRADAIARLTGHDTQMEKVFLEPASVQLTLSDLLLRLSSRDADDAGSPVYYLQSQNSNLSTAALSPLMKDLPDNFTFAEDVLGEPDARNIWIGTEDSVTSVHRDPYENLYLVIKGSKTFRLWPPVDEIAMPTKLVRTGTYTYDATKSLPFDVMMDVGNEKIPWIDLDPLIPQDEQKLAAKGAKMRTVQVREGEILYLPSGWYHHVSQSCGFWEDGSVAPCIAVNYWYDMDYEGERYVMRQLVSRLVEAATSTQHSSLEP